MLQSMHNFRLILMHADTDRLRSQVPQLSENVPFPLIVSSEATSSSEPIPEVVNPAITGELLAHRDERYVQGAKALTKMWAKELGISQENPRIEEIVALSAGLDTMYELLTKEAKNKWDRSFTGLYSFCGDIETLLDPKFAFDYITSANEYLWRGGSLDTYNSCLYLVAYFTYQGVQRFGQNKEESAIWLKRWADSVTLQNAQEMERSTIFSDPLFIPEPVVVELPGEGYENRSYLQTSGVYIERYGATSGLPIAVFGLVPFVNQPERIRMDQLGRVVDFFSGVMRIAQDCIVDLDEDINALTFCYFMRKYRPDTTIEEIKQGLRDQSESATVRGLMQWCVDQRLEGVDYISLNALNFRNLCEAFVRITRMLATRGVKQS